MVKLPKHTAVYHCDKQWEHEQLSFCSLLPIKILSHENVHHIYILSDSFRSYLFTENTGQFPQSFFEYLYLLLQNFLELLHPDFNKTVR